MIRLTFVLRRKPDLTREEFQDYWRRQHGPLVAKHSTRLGMLRYVQVHTLDDPVNEQMAEARGGMEEPYDGVAELWWWSRERIVEALAEQAAQDAGAELLEDEREFIDLERSPLWFAHEYPQVNPVPEDAVVARERSPIVKLFFCLRQPAGQSEQEAQVYWRTAHGPIIRSIAHAGGILRYVQVHRVEDELEGALREARGTVTEPYTGHAELWYDRRGFGNSVPERARGGQLAIADESTFIDFKRSAMWIAKERVFVDVR
jgi:uncharacterized protein (TIGR02118 family)